MQQLTALKVWLETKLAEDVKTHTQTNTHSHTLLLISSSVNFHVSKPGPSPSLHRSPHISIIIAVSQWARVHRYSNWLPRTTRHSQRQPASFSQLLSKAEREEREGAARAEQQRKTLGSRQNKTNTTKQRTQPGVWILPSPLTTVSASSSEGNPETERMLITCSSRKVLLQCSAVSECRWWPWRRDRDHRPRCCCRVSPNLPFKATFRSDLDPVCQEPYGSRLWGFRVVPCRRPLCATRRKLTGPCCGLTPIHLVKRSQIRFLWVLKSPKRFSFQSQWNNPHVIFESTDVSILCCLSRSESC